MASKIVKIQLGSNPALMVGDSVVTRTKPSTAGVVLKVRQKVVTIRPCDRHQLDMELRRQDVRLTRTYAKLPAEIGCLVSYQNGTLKGTGTLERVDGSYNYILDSKTTQVLEFYPNEIKVQALFRHPDFLPGTVVRFLDPTTIVWGKLKRTTHGVVRGVTETHILVQPMESRSGTLLSVTEDSICAEVSKMREPLDESELADLALSKLAIRALLVTCGQMMVGQLTGLLATQGQKEETAKALLFELVAEGKVTMDKDHVLVTSTESDVCVQASVRDALFAATDAVRKAKTALADCVFRTIADTGSRLPR